MNRSQVIDKIRAMMALQESSTFEGEAHNAAVMIEKLCKKFGVNIETDLTPQVYDELYSSGRHRDYVKWILNAVAQYYDAMLYTQGNTTLKLIGTEAQQIQVKLYSDFILECMEKEARKAYEGEKMLAELTNNTPPNRTFLHAFKQAFAQQVCVRLKQMKQDKHEHAEVTAGYLSTRKFGKSRAKTTIRGGSGAIAGYSSGESVSLNKQATGSSRLALSGS